eukprot:3013004-Rhodomonas_salina.1
MDAEKARFESAELDWRLKRSGLGVLDSWPCPLGAVEGCALPCSSCARSNLLRMQQYRHKLETSRHGTVARQTEGWRDVGYRLRLVEI